MRAAILCNNDSSKKSARMELIMALREEYEKVYVGGIYDGEVNACFNDKTATFLSIKGSRNNTNPLKEIQSIISVKKQIKKESIDTVIVYGIKNHGAMGIGAYWGGAKKILYVVNGSGNLFNMGGLKGKIVRLMAFTTLRFAYSKAKAICFQNPDDKDKFIKLGLVKKTADAFVTNGSGVNLSVFPYENILVENRFLYIARITSSKGILEFIKASEIVKKSYPEYLFDVFGPVDNENSSLLALIKDANSKGIINYYGATDDVQGALKNSTIFVYPSYYPEGVPRCVLQALSTGRPVITCNTPGCKETVENGYNGLIVEPRSVEKLADAMQWMIENSEEVEKMALRSRKLAESRFDVHKINELLIQKLGG